VVNTCLFVCDRDYHRIQLLYAANGEFVNIYGSCGYGDDQFKYPIGVCILPPGQIIVNESERDGLHQRVQILK
jgi:hypothetical protein